MPRPMGSTRFRIPPALSSVLAVLGTLQLRAVGILNRVDPLVSASNLYVDSESDPNKKIFWPTYDCCGVDGHILHSSECIIR